MVGEKGGGNMEVSNVRERRYDFTWIEVCLEQTRGNQHYNSVPSRKDEHAHTRLITFKLLVSLEAFQKFHPITLLLLQGLRMGQNGDRVSDLFFSRRIDSFYFRS